MTEPQQHSSSPPSISAPPRSSAAIAEVSGDPPAPVGQGCSASAWSERRGPPRRGARHRGDDPRHRQGDERRPADGGRRGRLGLLSAIAGEHVAGRTSHGMVSVTGDEIRTSDVARVNDMASNVSFGRDHELLHAIPQDYLVDQQGGISEPIGMTGSRLEAEVYLVTVLSSVLQNLRKCVEQARATTWASSCSSRSPPRSRCSRRDERELGCAIVELGGGSTNVAIFQQRQDPAHGLAALRRRACHQRHRPRAPGDPADAERLKERSGAAWEPLVPEADIIRSAQHARARAPGPRSAGCWRTSCTCGCRRRWSTRSTKSPGPGYHQRLPAGVILTGGGALDPGHRGAGPRGLRDAGAGAGSPGQGLRGLADSVEIAAHGGDGGSGALRRAAGSFQVRLRDRRPPELAGGRESACPVKRWLQDFF